MKSKNDIWFEFLIAVCCLCMIFLIWKIGCQSMKSEIEFKNEIQNSEPSMAFEIEAEDLEMCEPIEIENPSVYPLTDYDRWYVECIVAGEAKGESMLGKMAVAQCILNAMQKEEFTPKEVKSVYKYCGWDDDLEIENPEMYDEVKLAVWRVFDNGEVVTDKPILYFYAYKYTVSNWHESLNHADTIGGHKFFYLDEDVEADWFMEMKERMQNGN